MNDSSQPNFASGSPESTPPATANDTDFRSTGRSFQKLPGNLSLGNGAKMNASVIKILDRLDASCPSRPPQPLSSPECRTLQAGSAKKSVQCCEERLTKAWLSTFLDSSGSKHVRWFDSTARSFFVRFVPMAAQPRSGQARPARGYGCNASQAWQAGWRRDKKSNQSLDVTIHATWGIPGQLHLQHSTRAFLPLLCCRRRRQRQEVATHHHMHQRRVKEL